MPEAYDLTLATKGYMVAPKSYRRGHDHQGRLGSPPTRIVRREFLGGLRPPDSDPARFAYSIGCLPARNGPGVVPGGKNFASTIANTDASARRYSVMLANNPYVGTGVRLWRVDRTGSNFNTATQMGGGVLGSAINGMATNGVDKIYMSRTGGGYVTWTIGGALDATATLQFECCAFHAGAFWGGYLNAGIWRIAKATGGATIDGNGYPIVGQPVCMITGRDGIYTATRHGLWRTQASTTDVSGNTISVNHQQILRADGSGRQDDWNYLAEFRGDLYAWYNGGIHRYSQGGAAGEHMQPIGLWGTSCAGLAAAAGFLVAAVAAEPDSVPGTNGQVDLWAYDGQGWWRLTDTGADMNGVIPTNSFCEDGQVISIRGTEWRGYQIRPIPGQPGYPVNGHLVTSLLDGGEPDVDKIWLRAGIELGWLAFDTFTACTALVAYSINGNGAFTTLASNAAISDSTPVSVVGDFPANTRRKAIALRYGYDSVSDGAPVLRAIWAEYRPVEAPLRKRQWEFDVLISDGQVKRDGSAEPRTGQQIAADLWAQFNANAALTLKDIDYDLDATTRQVRIAYLDQVAPKPKDGGLWAEGTVRVRLVED